MAVKSVPSMLGFRFSEALAQHIPNLSDHKNHLGHLLKFDFPVGVGPGDSLFFFF